LNCQWTWYDKLEVNLLEEHILNCTTTSYTVLTDTEFLIPASGLISEVIAVSRRTFNNPAHLAKISFDPA